MCKRYIREETDQGETETKEIIGKLINERNERINYYSEKANILSSFLKCLLKRMKKKNLNKEKVMNKMKSANKIVEKENVEYIVKIEIIELEGLI